ncbi:hypothetical protein MSATCC14277_4360 [Metamycoplasma salivarium]|uniref:hypothetical protein n=1 Tax=Metamycoplasma salivarium TaxID=2124 RepID=UPI001F29921B|nr:hypothetical protein [Metamycoplasma salivarium]GIZ05854.1 hypothetical protein MSATCC14277_4360 [Metamycoplasma salivarium]
MSEDFKKMDDGFIKNVGKKPRFDFEEEKQKILSHPKIKEIILNLKLDSSQISKGMHFLQKYYNYIVEKNVEPSWKLTLNDANLIDIDLSNEENFKKQKMFSNFWLTNITPLDADLEQYFFSNKPKPRKILQDATIAMAAFPNAISDTIAIITNLKTNKGLFLADENFVNARKIFKYLLTLFGTKKNKSVAFIETNNLYTFYYNNSKDVDLINSINDYLMNVDYLFLDKFGIGTKPEWFLNHILTILIYREDKQKPVFMASPVDITNKNVSLMFNINTQTKNEGLEKLEKLLKNTINRTMIKFIAKSK